MLSVRMFRARLRDLSFGRTSEGPVTAQRTERPARPRTSPRPRVLTTRRVQADELPLVVGHEGVARSSVVGGRLTLVTVEDPFPQLDVAFLDAVTTGREGVPVLGA